MKSSLLIQGMHGLGDNLHQRAIIRQLLPNYEIWLETSWVAPYWDLIDQGLHPIRKPTNLRTQIKNSIREGHSFSKVPVPFRARKTKNWYPPQKVKSEHGVLAAMLTSFPGMGLSIDSADFRLPIKPEWNERAIQLIASWNTTKPIMIVRPLVDRKEWNGCQARNPDHHAYSWVFDCIRDKFYVVSIADIVPNVEWIDCGLDADREFHKGELSFEILAALFRLASLVYCSPGFAVVLSQAVQTPCIALFGTYERAYSFSAGARFSPFLGIEPRNPKDDFSHDTKWPKDIDATSAVARANGFIAAALANRAASKI